MHHALERAKDDVHLDLPVWIQIAAAIASLLWGALTPLAQLLVILTVIDVATGIISGTITKSLNSEASFVGACKKAIMFLLLGMAYALDPFTNSMLAMTQVSVSLSSMVASFFCINESISILENAANAGVPIPRTLRDALEKVKS